MTCHVLIIKQVNILNYPEILLNKEIVKVFGDDLRKNNSSETIEDSLKERKWTLEKIVQTNHRVHK